GRGDHGHRQHAAPGAIPRVPEAQTRHWLPAAAVERARADPSQSPRKQTQRRDEQRGSRTEERALAGDPSGAAGAEQRDADDGEHHGRRDYSVAAGVYTRRAIIRARNLASQQAPFRDSAER